MKSRFAALLALLVAGCAGPGIGASAMPASPIGAAIQAHSSGQELFAYAPDGKGLVARYSAGASGRVSPSALLAGSNTNFAGGSANLFGGAIEIESGGTLYVFDATRALLLTFGPRAGGDVARGNVAPERVEHLPPNSNLKLNIPQYSGFAPDSLGNFWTVDRSDGHILRFPLSAKGAVQPTATLIPNIDTPQGINQGTASTVVGDGSGHIFCSCQDHDLALQLYAISEYDVKPATPKLIRSFYGILGDLDSQFPSSVMYVDTVTQTIYLGIYRPAAVIAYPVATRTGHAPPPRLIGGVATMLDTVPASLTTDTGGNLYVAQGSNILVFAPKASGNIKPKRVMSDPRHLQIAGYAYGNMLAIRAPH